MIVVVQTINTVSSTNNALH